MNTLPLAALPALDWIVVAVYMAAMIAIGVVASRTNKSLEDYFVGGRNVGAFAAGLSLLATLVSSNSYLAVPGEVISHGTGFLWEVFGYIPVFFIIGYLLIPHIMAVPVNSGYELLEKRLGGGVRSLAATLFVLIRMLWMGLILHTACSATHQFTGWPREVLIVALGVITLIYTAEGGIRAVIWTDVVQFFILIGGAIFTVIFLMYRGGFSSAALATDTVSRLNVPIFSFDPTQRITAFNIAFSSGLWWIATCGSDQVAMQKFFTTRDARAARRSFLVNLIANTATLVALALIGVALFRYYGQNPGLLPAELRELDKSGDKIFPYFITYGLPRGLAGLVVAALFAAAMSSLSSGFNSVTTVLTVDFLQRGQRIDNSGAMSRQQQRRAQLVTLLVGAVVIVIGFLVPLVGGNFFEIANRLLNPLVGPLFGLFAIAFFLTRASPAAAWVGFVAGTVTALFIAYAHVLLRMPQPISFTWIMPASIAVTIGAAWLTTLPQALQTQARREEVEPL